MKSIKLLLTENVDNLGIVGDVVTVKPGFARNFLIPQGKATEPTQGNIDRLAERRAQVAEEMKIVRAEREELLAKLEEVEILLERSTNEQGVLFGGVSQHDIADELREKGFKIDDRMVRIGQQIKRVDEYQIPVVLANDLKTEVKLTVISDKPVEEESEKKEENQERKPKEDPFVDEYGQGRDPIDALAFDD